MDKPALTGSRAIYRVISFQMHEQAIYMYFFLDTSTLTYIYIGFSLVNWLFPLENYNFGSAIAVTPADFICIRTG